LFPSTTIYAGELGSSAPVKMVEMVESQAKIAFPTLVSNPELSVHYAYRKRQRLRSSVIVDKAR
jgi:hypothetical protein